MIRIISLLLFIVAFFFLTPSHAEENKPIVFNKDVVSPDVYEGLKNYIEESQSIIEGIENLRKYHYCAVCGLGSCKTCAVRGTGGAAGATICAVKYPGCQVGFKACSDPVYDNSCRAGNPENPEGLNKK